MTLRNLLADIKNQADPKRAKASLWFFKTGPGQYGEGDKFAGLTLPQIRLLAKKYRELPIGDIKKLLDSPVHEQRLLALILLDHQFKNGDERCRTKIYKFYLAHTGRINNWDLVDSSASYIVGSYLVDKNRRVLYRLAKSKNLWEKRIAIIATQKFIAHNQFRDTLRIAEILLHDKHDLIHKAVGWMLREVGKRDLKTEIEFLDKYYQQMPRTMLRYAIEKFPDKLKRYYMAK